MSSYLSNLLTETTSKYNSLRRTLLNNEDDGDTEDDSHISRVLRAYYTEKGRSFPPWLPPDPNDRRAAMLTPQPHTYMQQQNSGYFAAAGGGSQVARTPGGGLSDLWDAPASASVQPQSLRAGRRPVVAAAATSSMLAPPQARPLPSQRAGSYQNSRPAMQPSEPSSSGGGVSAQERLKAKLRGGRSGSPGPEVGSNAQWSSGQGSPYDTGGGGGASSRRYGRMG